MLEVQVLMELDTRRMRSVWLSRRDDQEMLLSLDGYY